MKIAITGHTQGIGKTLFDFFNSKGHSVKGFSKSNGYAFPESIDLLIQEIVDYDLFVNNAYWGFAQAVILDLLVRKWSDVPEKRIICLGSISADLVSTPYPLYAASKVALERLGHISQTRRTWPIITNLKLGMVDTYRTKDMNGPKLNVSDVEEIVAWLLTLPPHLAIPEIVVKHRDQLL